MAYVKIIFQNSPSTDTPINAENLNHMDDQIALNDQRLTEIETSYVKSFKGRKGEVVPENGDYDIGQIAPLSGAQVGQVPVVTNIGTEEAPELVFRMGAGGGAGGHEIIDSEDNIMPQESAMQFADSHVSDDPVNGITIVENIKEVLPADYDSTTDEGIIVCDDGNDVPIGDIGVDYEEVEAGAHTTVSALLDELYSKIDFTKISKSSIFERIETNGAKYIFTIQQITSSNVIIATLSVVSNARTSGTTWHVKSSGSKSYDAVFGSTPTDDSGTELTEHTKFRLYYGTSSTVINLKTSADYCTMSDGVTSVESALSYSTTEHVVGKWIDGRTLYEKTIDFGRMPNTTTKSVAHGISNLRFVYEIRGVTILESGSPHTTIPLPNVVAESANFSYQSQISVDPTNVNIVTSRDRSEWNAYVTLRYTKTS